MMMKCFTSDMTEPDARNARGRTETPTMGATPTPCWRLMMTQTTMTPITRSFFYGGLPAEQRSNTVAPQLRARMRPHLERDYAFDQELVIDNGIQMHGVSVRVISTSPRVADLLFTWHQQTYIKNHFMVLLYQAMLHDRFTRIDNKAYLTFVMQDSPFLRVIVTVDNIDAHMKDASLNAWLDTPYDQKFYYLRQMTAMLGVLNEELDEENAPSRSLPLENFGYFRTDRERFYDEMMCSTFLLERSAENLLIKAFYARFFEVAYRVDTKDIVRDAHEAVCAYLSSNNRKDDDLYSNETLMNMLSKTAFVINTWVAYSDCCAPLRF